MGCLGGHNSGFMLVLQERSDLHHPGGSRVIARQAYHAAPPQIQDQGQERPGLASGYSDADPGYWHIPRNHNPGDSCSVGNNTERLQQPPDELIQHFGNSPLGRQTQCLADRPLPAAGQGLQDPRVTGSLAYENLRHLFSHLCCRISRLGSWGFGHRTVLRCVHQFLFHQG